jgi:DNA-binding CsgD family transcriptional regulator
VAETVPGTDGGCAALADAPDVELSERETEVLELLAAGTALSRAQPEVVDA